MNKSNHRTHCLFQFTYWKLPRILGVGIKRRAQANEGAKHHHSGKEAKRHYLQAGDVEQASQLCFRLLSRKRATIMASTAQSQGLATIDRTNHDQTNKLLAEKSRERVGNWPGTFAGARVREREPLFGCDCDYDCNSKCLLQQVALRAPKISSVSFLSTSKPKLNHYYRETLPLFLSLFLWRANYLADK